MEENQTKKENFWDRAKAWGKDKVDKTTDFITKNPFLILPILSIGGSILGGIFKSISDGRNDQYDACRVEDDITGEEFVTKHPLTNEEILELGERMIDGQPKGVALDDMGLLRNERRRR